MKTLITLFFNDSAITDTFKTISYLNPETKYFWRVSARNDSGYFASSNKWNFTTYGILIAPANNANFSSVTANFLWHKLDGALRYKLQVSRDLLFNDLIVNDLQGFHLLNSLWHVNIYTNVFPGGEIRGQLSGGGTLPVQLSAFTSNIIRDKVTLNWSTSSELNNAGFDVERTNVKNGSSDD